MAHGRDQCRQAAKAAKRCGSVARLRIHPPPPLSGRGARLARLMRRPTLLCQGTPHRLLAAERCALASQRAISVASGPPALTTRMRASFRSWVIAQQPQQQWKRQSPHGFSGSLYLLRSSVRTPMEMRNPQPAKGVGCHVTGAELRVGCLASAHEPPRSQVRAHVVMSPVNDGDAFPVVTISLTWPTAQGAQQHTRQPALGSLQQSHGPTVHSPSCGAG